MENHSAYGTSPLNSNNFHDFCADISLPTTVDELWAVATSYYADQGVDGLLYADVKPHGTTLLTSLGTDWTDHYTESEYITVDPFFLYCCNSYAAMNIGPDCVPDHNYMSDKEKQFIMDASDTGMIAGFSSPIRLRTQLGLTGWSFLSSHGRRHIDNLRRENENELRLIGALIHQHIAELNTASIGTVELTEREIEVLQWTANGLRTAMIAAKMKLRPVTVEFHLRNARDKLNAKTRDQAVALALVRGLIML